MLSQEGLQVFKNVTCSDCGAASQIGSDKTEFRCSNCGSLEQISGVDHGTAGHENDGDLENLQEAEQYKLQAEFILHQLQANVQVFGSNSAWSGAQPADVELALRYIDRSLEHYPENPAYLNLKALLLIEGRGEREAGLALLERAHQLNPRDITIEDNLTKLKAGSCFVATAAYGSADAWQVTALRRWRDEALIQTRAGAIAVSVYYRMSPRLALLIKKNHAFRRATRVILLPLTRLVARKYRGGNAVGGVSPADPTTQDKREEGFVQAEPADAPPAR